MRLIDMQTELFDQLGYGDAKGSPDDRLMARFARQLNVAYKEVLGRKGLSKLRLLTDVPFSCIANVATCTLPITASRVINIQDRVNNRDLVETTLHSVRKRDPGLTLSQAFPYEYLVVNYMAPTAQDPTVADHVFVKSTSASDTGGPTAYLQAVLANSYPRLLTQNLAGTVAQDFDGTVTNITQIRKFFLSAPGKGDIILNQTSGAGTELARIPAGKTMARYTRLLMYPKPTQVNTYYADIELAFEPLVFPNDEPLIPEPFDYIVTARALMREFQKRGKQAQYGVEAGRFQKGISELILFLAKQAGPATGQGVEFSQLGSYFPAGS